MRPQTTLWTVSRRLPADVSARFDEVLRLTRAGYKLCGTYQDDAGVWWARVEPP
jgi:hypothetical protein